MMRLFCLSVTFLACLFYWPMVAGAITADNSPNAPMTDSDSVAESPANNSVGTDPPAANTDPTIAAADSSLDSNELTSSDAFQNMRPAEQFNALKVRRNKIIYRLEETSSTIDSLSEQYKAALNTKVELENSSSPSFPLPSKEDITENLNRLERDLQSLNRQLSNENLSADARAELDTKISEKESAISDMKSFLESYNERQKQIEDSKKENERSVQSNLERIASLESQIKLGKSNLVTFDRYLQDVDEKIATLLAKSDSSNDFKKIMSVVFAGLVAVVIAGFFIIAFRDQTVRAAIFSNESGIQFITLFSLVIAIILFGIVGILEGKELSALLGGLSGYILGRSTPKAA